MISLESRECCGYEGLNSVWCRRSILSSALLTERVKAILPVTGSQQASGNKSTGFMDTPSSCHQSGRKSATDDRPVRKRCSGIVGRFCRKNAEVGTQSERRYIAELVSCSVYNCCGLQSCFSSSTSLHSAQSSLSQNRYLSKNHSSHSALPAQPSVYWRASSPSPALEVRSLHKTLSRCSPIGRLTGISAHSISEIIQSRLWVAALSPKLPPGALLLLLRRRLPGVRPRRRDRTNRSTSANLPSFLVYRRGTGILLSTISCNMSTVTSLVIRCALLEPKTTAERSPACR